MNHRDKRALVERANERRTNISDAKGPEYAGQADTYMADDSDVLANFKRQGRRWGTDALQAAAIYFGKHIDSIETFIREMAIHNGSRPEQWKLVNRGEGIISRLDDARNYLDLLECLLAEIGLHPEARIAGVPNPDTAHPLSMPTYRIPATSLAAGRRAAYPTANVNLVGDECPCGSCGD